MAFLRRGRPYSSMYELVSNAFLPSCLPGTQYTLVGEYWLQSTRSKASFAASRANLGGL